MNTKQLAKNIAKPFFINNIYISEIKAQPVRNIEFGIDFNFILKIKSKHNNLNDVNILELINWFNSFDKIKIIYWDDDKEFDFSDVNYIDLIIQFDLINVIYQQQNDKSKIELESELINILISRDYHLQEMSKNWLFYYFNNNKIAKIELNNHILI